VKPFFLLSPQSTLTPLLSAHFSFWFSVIPCNVPLSTHTDVPGNRIHFIARTYGATASRPRLVRLGGVNSGPGPCSGRSGQSTPCVMSPGFLFFQCVQFYLVPVCHPHYAAACGLDDPALLDPLGGLLDMLQPPPPTVPRPASKVGRAGDRSDDFTASFQLVSPSKSQKWSTSRGEASREHLSLWIRVVMPNVGQA